MPSSTVDKKSIVIVSLLLAAAAILRFAFLAHQSLWLDEFASWSCSKLSFWGALACDPQKPPLYYSFLHYWMLWFGTGEAAMRSLSVVPGIASVWVIYLLGTKLFSRPVGYLAAAYQAFSAFQIYFAQEARNYTWLVFFMLLAGLCLWEALEAGSRKARMLYWAGYTTSITLALYTHYFAVFFVGGHGLYVLLRRRRQLIPITVGVALALGLVAPFALFFIHHPASAADQIRRFPLLKFPQAYFCFLFGESLIPFDDRAVRHMVQTLQANWLLVVLAAGSLATLTYYGWRARNRWREPLLFVAFHASVPVVVAFFVSMKKSFFDRRYMIPASPYIYLLVAAAVFEVLVSVGKPGESRWKVRWGLAASCVFGLLMAVSLYQYFFGERFGKEQWREAVAYIESSSSTDGKDLVIWDPDYLQLCYQYYQKRNLPGWMVRPEDEQQAMQSPAFLRDRAHGFHKVWLVYSHNLNQDMLTALRRTYPQQSAREFPLSNGIEVYSFDVAGGS